MFNESDCLGNQGKILLDSFNKDELVQMQKLMSYNIPLEDEKWHMRTILDFIHFISINYLFKDGEVNINYRYEYLFNKSQHKELTLRFDDVDEDDLVKTIADSRSKNGYSYVEDSLDYPARMHECNIFGDNLACTCSNIEMVYENHDETDQYEYFIIPNIEHTVTVVKHWLESESKGEYNISAR